MPKLSDINFKAVIVGVVVDNLPGHSFHRWARHELQCGTYS